MNDIIQAVKGITQQRIKDMLNYNPETGVFVWENVTRYHPRMNGKVAGTARQCRGKKYIHISIDGVKCKAHRLAWLYVNGNVPAMIDHINGDSTDNRILNLRACTHTRNSQNHTRIINNSCLPTGVRRATSGKYVARIRYNNKKIHLGTFETIREAMTCYENARRENHDAPAAFG